MEEAGRTPTMLRFIFGERATAAQRGVSERLIRWSRAFDEWLEERGTIFRPSTRKQSRLAWKRLLQVWRNEDPGTSSSKMPWELEKGDIEQFMEWMKAKGYAASTIANSVGMLANFYRWFGERWIDPEWVTGFNPAAEVKRPKVKRYDRAALLSRGEIEALLDILERDETALGKRDHAFFLARLRMGVPLRALQQLQWGQIEGEDEGREGKPWVRWQGGGGRTPLPKEVWEAILDYLGASGRLEQMREGDYVFAPLLEPGKDGKKNSAEDWVREQHISTSQILRSLKLYGEAVGIAGKKLSLQALRRTAVRLKLDEGSSIEEMQVFMNSEEDARFIKYRLGKLPQLPEDGNKGDLAEGEAQVPERRAKPYKPGDGLKHGYYAKSQPEEEVKAVMAEDIQGIKEEISGLRWLARELVVKQKEAATIKEAMKLADTHILAVYRVAELMKAEEQLVSEEEGESWGEDAMGLDSNSLKEEIATVRYMLRNVLARAFESEDTAEFVRLVQVYGSGCLRLVRVLKQEKSNEDNMERYLSDLYIQKIDELAKEIKWLN